jgi:SAM-dependent methyltransferase
MSFLVPPRRPSLERLDDPSVPSDEMRRSLEDLCLVNRRWGGSRALERHLVPRARALGGRRVSILDVGAGSGDVAGGLRQALSAAGCDAFVVALDLQWRHLAAGRGILRQAPAASVTADAFQLPFADGAFDFAVSTLFFHHFSPEENRSLLREFGRVARVGVAVLDLRRHRLPELFVALVGRAVFRARISVEDGRASVRQAYTPEEALAVARPVWPGSRARRVFPFRWLLTGGP